jgi:hypothetical protein
MSEHLDAVEREEPNAVLRGGPLDGIRVRVHAWAPITLDAGDLAFVYRSLGKTDSEYPSLSVYVFDHAETA